VNLSSSGRYRDWGILLLCNLIWGSQFVIYKIVQRQVGPVFAALLPITFATVLLTPIVRHRRQKRNSSGQGRVVPRRDIWQFVLIGIGGQVVTQLFVAWGVRYTLASNAALIALALPISTALMAYLILSERMTRIRWASFAFAIAGVIVCSGINWKQVNLVGSDFLLGNAMLFLAINGSAFYNVYSKKLLTRYSPLEVLLYSYYVVVVFMLPIGLYTQPKILTIMEHFTVEVWTGILLLGVFQYFLAMILFLTVLTRLDATQAGLSNYLITFFGVITAAIVLHETLTKFMIFGGLLVLASTLLVTVFERSRPLKESSANKLPV
jgi:drug/metabolite transporter (DMT)-like permease